MPFSIRLLSGLLGLTVMSAALSACQNQRNEFNPVRIMCPGDFDPVTNSCKIDTGPLRE